MAQPLLKLTLAQNYAQFLEKVLSSWQENKTTGKECLFGFMTWHKDLSICTSVATNQSRISCFNKNNDKLVFKKTEEIQTR